MSDTQFTSQQLRNEVTNAYVTNEDFRTALLANPEGAVTQLVGEVEMGVRLHKEAEREIAIVVPHRSEELEAKLNAMVEGIEDNSPSRAQFDAKIILKAWNDDGFRGELEANARSTVAGLMSEYEGAELPEDVTVNAYFEGADECVITLPVLSAPGGELSDDDLESVAGGESALIAGAVVGAVVGSVAGAIAGKVVDVMWNSATLSTTDKYSSFGSFDSTPSTGGRIRFF